MAEPIDNHDRLLFFPELPTDEAIEQIRDLGWNIPESFAQHLKNRAHTVGCTMNQKTGILTICDNLGGAPTYTKHLERKE